MAKPYDQIPDRRAIVRRRALEETLAHLVEDLPSGGEPPRPLGGRTRPGPAPTQGTPAARLATRARTATCGRHR